MSSGEIILLTGGLLSGKTSLCLEIAKKAKENRLEVAGIISPAVFTGSQKTAIDALDLRTWKRKRLAELRTEKKTDLETRRWSFDPSVINWGNQVLADALPCDLLIIDELGPLEFERSEGWMEGLSVLGKKEYKAAVVVIRPTLIDAAKKRWEISQQINLDQTDQPLSLAEDIFSSIDFFGLGEG
jgi:nucleoside-triphosphatase THEP1